MPYSGTNRSLANLHDNRKPLQCWLARPRAFKYIPAARLSVAPAPVQHSVAARPLCHETTPGPPNTTTHAPRMHHTVPRPILDSTSALRPQTKPARPSPLQFIYLGVLVDFNVEIYRRSRTYRITSGIPKPSRSKLCSVTPSNPHTLEVLLGNYHLNSGRANPTHPAKPAHKSANPTHFAASDTVFRKSETIPGNPTHRSAIVDCSAAKANHAVGDQFGASLSSGIMTTKVATGRPQQSEKKKMTVDEMELDGIIPPEAPVELDVQPDALEQQNDLDASEASQSESGNLDVDGEVMSMGDSDIVVPLVVSVPTSAPSPIPPPPTRRSSRKREASNTHEDAPAPKSKKTEAAVAPEPSVYERKRPKRKPKAWSVRPTDDHIYTSFKFLAQFPEEYRALYGDTEPM
ncbi:hypothetical protein DFH09DRAFT_1088595 [Mycena vulgaris]|nr:hypothetical protein DFH09DRAFT_1088595 [Mycena vulgaris]